MSFISQPTSPIVVAEKKEKREDDTKKCYMCCSIYPSSDTYKILSYSKPLRGKPAKQHTRYWCYHCYHNYSLELCGICGADQGGSTPCWVCRGEMAKEREWETHT